MMLKFVFLSFLLVAFHCPVTFAALALTPQQSVATEQGSNTECPCARPGIRPAPLSSFQTQLDTMAQSISTLENQVRLLEQRTQATKDMQNTLSTTTANLETLAITVNSLASSVSATREVADKLERESSTNKDVSAVWKAMVGNVQASVQSQGSGLTAVSNSMTALSSVVTSMSTLVTSIDLKVQKMEQQVGVINITGHPSKCSQNTSQGANVDTSEMANHTSSVSHHRTPQVAFSVKFKADPAPAIEPHNRYLFDDIITNIGEAYNLTTGQFSAPVSGLYAFYLKVMSTNTHGAVHAAITTSSKGPVGHVFAEGASDVYDQGPLLITTHLEKGEKVWAKYVAGISHMRGGLWSVFTGFLLHSDSV